MKIPVKTGSGEYIIHFERGALGKIGEIFDLDRKVLIVTDSGVPCIYSQKIYSSCKQGYIFTIEQGEKSKNLDNFKTLLEYMVKNNFTRTDCVVAVGGGVVGDLSGFVASAYMRGVDFYNVPTTVLSQVDSSIGGKTAVDFMGYKNIVGSFYQPKAVLIDPDTLSTLPKRQINNGLSEALKSALIGDAYLFDIFENEDIMSNIDIIIQRSIDVKKRVVQEDEKESGLRKTLNFGHTIAHAIESTNNLEKYYHGECVAIGMVPMCSDNVRERLLKVLKKLDLPTEANYSPYKLIEACKHDKKMSGEFITAVYVNEIGTACLKKMDFHEFEMIVKKVFEK